MERIMTIDMEKSAEWGLSPSAALLLAYAVKASAWRLERVKSTNGVEWWILEPDVILEWVPILGAADIGPALDELHDARVLEVHREDGRIFVHPMPRARGWLRG